LKMTFGWTTAWDTEPEIGKKNPIIILRCYMSSLSSSSYQRVQYLSSNTTNKKKSFALTKPLLFEEIK